MGVECGAPGRVGTTFVLLGAHMGWGQDGLGKCGMERSGVLGISVRVDVAARRLVLGDDRGDGGGRDGAGMGLQHYGERRHGALAG